MKRFLTLALTIFSFQSIISAYASLPLNTAFIAKKNGKIIKMVGNCDTQNPPCSTFKIALALMGFDAGILKDRDSPKWAFKPEYETNFQSWYKPEIGMKLGWNAEHTPATYMHKSVLWFSHEITKRLGKEKFQEYINRLNYGNRDVSGTSGQDDGLLNSWLNTSLKISPREQVENILEKMLETSLDISQDAQIKTREIMIKKDEDGKPIQWNNWKLYGKTGGGRGCHRWFVGWVEKDGEKIIFAQYVGLEQDTPQIRQNAPMAINTAKANILGLL